MDTLIGKYRFLLIAAVILLAILSVSQYPKLTINPSFNNYIPDEVGNRAYLKKLDSIFGGSEKIMLILTKDSNIINHESYDRIQRLSEELQNLQGIERCQSLADVIDIKLEDGITTFEPVVKDIPSDPAKLKNLENAILNNEIGKRFVSTDLTSTAIILTKSDSVKDNVIISEIQQVIQDIPGKEKIYLGGLSYIRQSIKSYIKKDLVTLLPAALILMILMLLFSFKEWKGVLLPFMIVSLSIITSFGLMAVMHWEISLISVLLPVMLIAIANDYSIHLINLYQEKCNTGQLSSMKETAAELYHELRKPILITGLTTIGGLLGLLTHKMPPAAQLGVLTSFGIGVALLMSLYLVPVLLTFYKKPKMKTKRQDRKQSVTAKILEISGKGVATYPKRVIIIFTAITILCIAGIARLKVDTNVEGYFLGKSDIKQGIDLVNKKFGGSQYVSVLFTGDVLSPELLKRIDKYTEEISKLPEVGHIISPSTFFKELSKGMYQPGEPGYLSLPRTEAEAEQYLEIVTMGGYEEQVSQFIDYSYKNARILLSMKDGSNHTGKAVLKSLKEITRGDPQLVCIAGPGLSKIQIADMVIHGQISSIIMALIIIFVLLLIIFKSFAAGIKGSLPIILSSLFLFGLMGFLNIPLDIITALLSSIMIGVGVDYTIHFLWRYKVEYAKNRDASLAVASTLSTAGRGIIFNAFSVIIGFSALIFSSFAPLRYFGVLIVISIFACLICALLLIPAIIILTKPAFLEPKSETKNVKDKKRGIKMIPLSQEG